MSTSNKILFTAAICAFLLSLIGQWLFHSRTNTWSVGMLIGTVVSVVSVVSLFSVVLGAVVYSKRRESA